MSPGSAVASPTLAAANWAALMRKAAGLRLAAPRRQPVHRPACSAASLAAQSDARWLAALPSKQALAVRLRQVVPLDCTYGGAALQLGPGWPACQLSKRGALALLP